MMRWMSRGECAFWLYSLHSINLFCIVFVVLGQTTQNDRWQSSHGNWKLKRWNWVLTIKIWRAEEISPECRLNTKCKKWRTNTFYTSMITHIWNNIMCVLSVIFCVRKQRYYHRAHSDRFYRLLTSGFYI